jgi:hypothetical protein
MRASICSFRAVIDTIHFYKMSGVVMRNMGLFSLLLCSLILLGACSLNKFNKMSSIEQMNTVMKGATEAQKNIETYDRVKKTVNTADKIYDTANTAAKELDKDKAASNTNKSSTVDTEAR